MSQTRRAAAEMDAVETRSPPASPGLDSIIPLTAQLARKEVEFEALFDWVNTRQRSLLTVADALTGTLTAEPPEKEVPCIETRTSVTH